MNLTLQKHNMLSNTLQRDNRDNHIYIGAKVCDNDYNGL